MGCMASPVCISPPVTHSVQRATALGSEGGGEGGREERGGRQGGREREIGGRDKGYSTCCPSRNAIDHAPKRYKDK